MRFYGSRLASPVNKNAGLRIDIDALKPFAKREHMGMRAEAGMGAGPC
jgi:hypothetical protein